MNSPTIELVHSTPRYVLMDKNGRIGPSVALQTAGIECSAIYGFSDKVTYDRFCLQSQQELSPYPLVKGYLSNQVDSHSSCLKLVVFDAAGPLEPYLYATTMKAVLEVYERKAVHVTADYQLKYDQLIDVYKVVEASQGGSAINAR